MAANTEPVIGQVIGGRYELGSLLARGAMATIYLAEDRRLSRQVAVKIMSPHLLDQVPNALFVSKFRREARAAARVTHPGIVAIYDQGFDDDISYLVMEHITGSSLRTELANFGTLPLGKTLTLLDQVLSAVAAAHRQGLIHRDIKPENVLITENGLIKVADFGLARAVTEVTQEITGTILGTVAYLAPEVITLAETSPRADIYAIGIMGYEMLVGRLPYDGDTPLEIAAQHVNVAIPNVRTVVSWVPVELSDLLARFAARDPRARPRDGEMALTELKRVRRALESNSPELLARRATPPNDFEEPETGEIPVVAIEQVGRDSAQLDEIPTKAFTADPQNPPTPPEPSAEPELLRRGQRGWMIAAVLTGLLLVGGGVWWGLARSGAPAPGIPETLELPQRVVTVPLGLVGSPRAAGEAALREAGVRFGAIYYEYTDLAPAGEIIDISHLEGEAIPYDTVLVLTVSGGPSPVTIPQQIGREWSDAVSTLAALGLIVEFDPEQPSETMPRGLVLLQEPADGVVVRRGDTVTLTISAGQLINDDDDGDGQSD